MEYIFIVLLFFIFVLFWISGFGNIIEKFSIGFQGNDINIGGGITFPNMCSINPPISPSGTVCFALFNNTSNTSITINASNGAPHNKIQIPVNKYAWVDLDDKIFPITIPEFSKTLDKFSKIPKMTSEMLVLISKLNEYPRIDAYSTEDQTNNKGYFQIKNMNDELWIYYNKLGKEPVVIKPNDTSSPIEIKNISISASGSTKKMNLEDLSTGNGFIVITSKLNKPGTEQWDLQSTVIDFYQRNCKKSTPSPPSPPSPPIQCNFTRGDSVWINYNCSHITDIESKSTICDYKKNSEVKHYGKYNDGYYECISNNDKCEKGEKCKNKPSSSLTPPSPPSPPIQCNFTRGDSVWINYNCSHITDIESKSTICDYKKNSEVKHYGKYNDGYYECISNNDKCEKGEKCKNKPSSSLTPPSPTPLFNTSYTCSEGICTKSPSGKYKNILECYTNSSYCQKTYESNCKKGKFNPCDCSKLREIKNADGQHIQCLPGADVAIHNIILENKQGGCQYTNCNEDPSEWCDAATCYKGGPKAIIFTNLTNKTLYFILTYNNKTWPNEQKLWDIKNSLNINYNPSSEDNNKNMNHPIYFKYEHKSVWVFKVLSKDVIIFTPKDKTKINNLTSGMFIVITAEHKVQIDSIINNESLDGLTELEFTVAQGGSFVPDISNLAGFNLSSDMVIYQKGTKKTYDAKINFDLPVLRNSKYKQNCPIPTYKMTKWSASLMGKYANSSLCGWTTEGDNYHPITNKQSDLYENCIKCQTGPDSCANIADKINSPCTYNEIYKRYQCYKWWSNPKNTYAQEWFDLLSNQLKLSTYRWVYDETKLNVNGSFSTWETSKLPFTNVSLTKNTAELNSLKSNSNYRDKWYNNDSNTASDFYDCYLNGKLGEQKCIGKVIPNPNQPGISTNLTGDLVLVFNIYDIFGLSEEDKCSRPSPGPGPPSPPSPPGPPSPPSPPGPPSPPSPPSPESPDEFYAGDGEASNTYYSEGDSPNLGACGGCGWPSNPNSPGDQKASFEALYDHIQKTVGEDWTLAATSEAMMGPYCPGSNALGMGCTGRINASGNTANAPCGSCWNLTQKSNSINVYVADACPCGNASVCPTTQDSGGHADNSPHCRAEPGVINSKKRYNHFDIWNGDELGFEEDGYVSFSNIQCPENLKKIMKKACCDIYWKKQGCPSICGDDYKCPPS